MQIKDKVAAILDIPGWTQVRLATETESSQSSVNRWLSGVEPRGLARDRINEIYESTVISPVNVKIVEHVNLPSRKVTVYGQAVAGINGEFIMNGNELFEVLAPPNLRSKDAYAIQFSGDSMWPRYEDGEIGFIDPKRRPKTGDYVVAQIAMDEHEPPLAYAKRLVRWNAAELVLEQLNPPEDPDNPGTHLPKEMKFPGDRVHSVHVIVMSGEA